MFKARLSSQTDCTKLELEFVYKANYKLSSAQIKLLTRAHVVSFVYMLFGLV